MNPLSSNKELRDKIYEYGLHYYEVAEELGLKPSNFSVKMKTYLTDKEKEKINTAIEKVYIKKVKSI